MINDDLLVPSLDQNVAKPIYSVGALIAAAFFGGAFAVPLLAAANSMRLRRLSRDAKWLVLGIAIAAAGILGTLAHFGSSVTEAGRTVRLLSRGLAFALAGGAYLLHREAYRASDAMGLERPSPYLAVIAASAVGTIATLTLLLAYAPTEETP